ncbi:PepSY domain-containing protein, partial [Faunimonas sp. B44]|uniref:PepSY domain-containing protein n=1 Tax=Faunimonas sp. B44 TaxID=3461493 RepID=UPI004044A6A9
MRSMTAMALAFGAALALSAASPAHADRDPTPEERSQVENQLRNLGFTSWEKIEWDDDGYWEIDDAVGSDGKEYDVHLAPDTFEVLKQEL